MKEAVISLPNLAAKLIVMTVSSFLLPRLLRFLEATDIYICPSQNPDQAVSGTLFYALGMGTLVNFNDSTGFSDGIIRFLENPELRTAFGKNAYFNTRHMTWPNVAIEYAKVFATLSKSLTYINESRIVPPLKLSHLFRLTDSFGVIQFAKLTEPGLAFGDCLGT